MHKGQVSIEAVTIIGMVLVIFSVMSYVTLTKQEQVVDVSKLLDYRLECSKIYNEVVNVYNMGDGSTSQVELEKNMTILGYSKRVMMGDFFCVLCCNVTNTEGKTFFNLCAGETNITNTGGELVFSNKCSGLSVELIGPGA